MGKRRRHKSPRADILLHQPELEQHHRVVVGDRIVFGEDGKPTSRSFGSRVLTQRMVDRYHVGKQITDRQHKAAGALWAAFYEGGMEPRVVASLEGTGGASTPGTTFPFSERQMAAQQLFREAIKAVGIYLSSVVVGVVCSDQPASACVRDRSGRQAEIVGLDRLRIGLDMLADHFQLDGRTL